MSFITPPTALSLDAQNLYLEHMGSNDSDRQKAGSYSRKVDAPEAVLLELSAAGLIEHSGAAPSQRSSVRFVPVSMHFTNAQGVGPWDIRISGMHSTKNTSSIKLAQLFGAELIVMRDSATVNIAVRVPWALEPDTFTSPYAAFINGIAAESMSLTGNVLHLRMIPEKIHLYPYGVDPVLVKDSRSMKMRDEPEVTNFYGRIRAFAPYLPPNLGRLVDELKLLELTITPTEQSVPENPYSL